MALLAKVLDLAAKHGYKNVEFRQEDVENLPAEDASVGGHHPRPSEVILLRATGP